MNGHGLGIFLQSALILGRTILFRAILCYVYHVSYYVSIVMIPITDKYKGKKKPRKEESGAVKEKE